MNQRVDYQIPQTTMLNVQARALTAIAIVIATFLVVTVHAQSRIYTTTADFDSAFLINSDGVDDEADGELAIRTVPQTLPYIWVACSLRGTVVRINTTEPRQVVGEYLTGPTNADGTTLCSRNPSRTAVDFDGNVWAGNRDDTDGKGSVVKIGSGFAFQWKDYDNDTILDTSAGLGFAGEKIAIVLTRHAGGTYTPIGPSWGGGPWRPYHESASNNVERRGDSLFLYRCPRGAGDVRGFRVVRAGGRRRSAGDRLRHPPGWYSQC